MRESEVPLPSTVNGCTLADWAEGTLLAEERKSLSKASIRQRLSNALHLDHGDLDVQMGLLFSEIRRRMLLASPNYPFRGSSAGLTRDATVDKVVYEFLLWLSISPTFREEERQSEVDQLFDDLAKLAAARYLGQGAVSVRFAHPSSDGRPSGFKAAIGWLCDLMDLPVGEANPRSAIKDGGVDVVAWRPFRDRRSGFTVLLCQCTVQLLWTGKGKDIVVDKWKGWISLGKAPLTALVVPFAVPTSYSIWDEVRRTVNIPIERLRLCELLMADDVSNLDVISDWNEVERASLAQAG